MVKLRAPSALGPLSRLAGVGILGLAVVSSARASEVTLERRLACTADAFRFCLSAIPNIEAVKACMIAHKAKLSPGCQAMFEKQR
jgi:hypothetical protein